MSTNDLEELCKELESLQMERAELLNEASWIDRQIRKVEGLIQKASDRPLGHGNPEENPSGENNEP